MDIICETQFPRYRPTESWCEVITQILAYPLQLVSIVDTVDLQNVGSPDPGKLQQLR